MQNKGFLKQSSYVLVKCKTFSATFSKCKNCPFLLFDFKRHQWATKANSLTLIDLFVKFPLISLFRLPAALDSPNRKTTLFKLKFSLSKLVDIVAPLRNHKPAGQTRRLKRSHLRFSQIPNARFNFSISHFTAELIFNFAHN